MDPSKTQRRIWEDGDFCALKIDNGFITNQWQLLSKLLISSCSFTNFSEMSNIFFSVRSVVFIMEFWLSWKFFLMNVAAFIVAAINILQIIESSSPESATFDTVFSLFLTWSFTLFTNSAASLPMTKVAEFASHWWFTASGCPRSIVNYLSVPYGLRTSVEKSFSMMRTNLLYRIPRSFIKLPRAIVCRNLTFPLLRRPRTIIIRFWVSCWCLSGFPDRSSPATDFPRSWYPYEVRFWWSWRRHDRWQPRC